MKAFCALHTTKPRFQLDNEAYYEGYQRVEVDFHEDFGNEQVKVIFPIIQSDSPDVVHYISIGAAERGQGEIFMCVPTLEMGLLQMQERRDPLYWMKAGATPEQAKEYIELYGFISPTVIVANTAPVTLPENLNPIARVAHKLVTSGLMDAEELHPKLYEAINDALHNAGVPVIPVIRSGAAKIDASLSQMPDLSLWNPEQEVTN